MQAVQRDQHAGILQRLVVAHHRGDAFGIELDVRRRGLVAERDHQHHELQRGSSLASSLRRTKLLRGRQSRENYFGGHCDLRGGVQDRNRGKKIRT